MTHSAPSSSRGGPGDLALCAPAYRRDGPAHPKWRLHKATIHRPGSENDPIDPKAPARVRLAPRATRRLAAPAEQRRPPAGVASSAPGGRACRPFGDLADLSPVLGERTAPGPDADRRRRA